MLKRLTIKIGTMAVIAIVFVLIQRRQMTGDHADQPKIQGESIQPSAPASETILASDASTNAPHKHKHPQPPPVQTRMLLAQFASSDPTNADNSMPAGTLGNAADLAKTNLVAASALPASHESIPGCEEISFSTLGGFDLALTKDQTEGKEPPAQLLAEVRAQIPKDIQALDGRKVVIMGFLLPVRMDDGLAVEFLLMRNQSMCCYGVPPKINEWITVKMTGKGVEPAMDRPIAVAGTFHAGPTQESGFLTGIYSMDGEKVLGPF